MAPAESGVRDTRSRTIVVVQSGRRPPDGPLYLYAAEEAAAGVAISTVQQQDFAGPIAVVVPAGCHPSELWLGQQLAEKLGGEEVLRTRKDFVRRGPALFDFDQFNGIQAPTIVTVQMAQAYQPDDGSIIAAPMGAVHAYAIEYDRFLRNRVNIRISRLV